MTDVDVSNKDTGKPSSTGRWIETAVFVTFIIVFAIGFMFVSLEKTGKVTFQDNSLNTNTLAVGQAFTSSGRINLILGADVTSLKVSGRHSENASFVIMLGDKVVARSAIQETIEERNIEDAIGELVDDGLDEGVDSPDVDPMDTASSENLSMLVSDPDLDINDTLLHQMNLSQENDTQAPDGNISLFDDLGVLEGVSGNESTQDEGIAAQPEPDQQNESVVPTEQSPLNQSEIVDTDALPGSNTASPVNESIIESSVIENDTIGHDTGLSSMIFTERCMESCYLETNNGNFTLMINVTSGELQIDSIVYAYISAQIDSFEPSFEAIVTLGPDGLMIPGYMQNDTLHEYNLTLNASNNASDWNISQIISNLSLNESANGSLEQIPEIGVINMTLNETFILENASEEINYSEYFLSLMQDAVPFTNYTDLLIREMSPDLLMQQDLTKRLNSEGLALESFTEVGGIFQARIRKDSRNHIRMEAKNFSDVDIDFIDLQDQRITSMAVKVNGPINSAEITLEYDAGNVLMRCAQYSEGCRKWVDAGIGYSIVAGNLYFVISSEGIYAIGSKDNIRQEILKPDHIYSLSNCERCTELYDCNAEMLCVMQNKLNDSFNFIAQLDFDVFDLDPGFESAEICGYMYYGTTELIMNYLKYSPESYCADIRKGNTSSSIISYKMITQQDGWICLDATEILSKAVSDKESNLFVNWLGNDLQGGAFPFNCFYGNIPDSNCTAGNMTGPNGCRPYMKVSYK